MISSDRNDLDPRFLVEHSIDQLTYGARTRSKDVSLAVARSAHDICNNYDPKAALGYLVEIRSRINEDGTFLALSEKIESELEKNGHLHAS
ncbi:MAG: hypothetical protein U9R75_02695, partial [Candidatus Thermoplasmatota archaeon]|nr:hypothetical protein [Candidatus Thermoplasmatota archaeon]